MQILTAPQLRALDKLTALEDDISSEQLMERASRAFVKAYRGHYGPERPLVVLCGTGNNGGDGLAIARLLSRSYNVTVLLANLGERSTDNAANFRRLKTASLKILPLAAGDNFPLLRSDTILIDALFGTGLNRPVEGYWERLIHHFNEQQYITVAVDLPSGLPADAPARGAVLKADLTISLGLPKLALLAPENTKWIGKWEIATFPLASPASVSSFGQDVPSGQSYLMEAQALRTQLKSRGANDHKGTFGHALLLAGSFGSMGAAILAGRAVLRAGAGKLTCHIPRSGYEIMQISFPEAMCKIDPHRYRATEIGDLTPYDVIAAGPGLGTETMTANALADVLQRNHKPLVLDADALNIISERLELLDLLPRNSILTPHPKEFSRLFGETEDDFARWQVQRKFSKKYGIYLLLKTGYTAIATPSGDLYFNPTGNPGMGTAGTGDVLTGTITGLLAQGYVPEVAATLGVYLHGLAGDIAAEELGQEFLLAEDVVRHLGKAFRQLREG